MLPGNRAQKYEELSKIIDRALEKKKAEKTGQMGLFDILSNTTQEPILYYQFQPLAEWPDKEKLEKEKEVLGLYISAQPLDTYAQQLQWIQGNKLSASSRTARRNIVITLRHAHQP